MSLPNETIIMTGTTVDQQELRGFTWRQAFIALVIVVSSTSTIMVTVLGTFYSLKGDMKDAYEVSRLNNIEVSKLRVDVDLLKIQVARLDQSVLINSNYRNIQQESIK